MSILKTYKIVKKFPKFKRFLSIAEKDEEQYIVSYQIPIAEIVDNVIYITSTPNKLQWEHIEYIASELDYIINSN